MANAWLLPPLPIIAATASSTATGDPAYLGNDFAGVIWKSPAVTSVSIILDLGADLPVDTLMLFGVYAPTAATLAVKGATSAQGSGFAGGAFADGGQIPLFAGANRMASGAGVSLWSAPAGWPAKVRYVQLGFGNATAASFQMARAVVGARIQLDRNFTFGASIGVKDLGSLDFARRGIMKRQRGRKLRTVSLSFSNARKEEVEAAIQPLIEQIGNTEVVALVTDPTADPMRERRCFFGPLVGDLQNVWRNAVAWEWKPNIVSIF